jgi:uroporphyrinogen decarboxylase
MPEAAAMTGLERTRRAIRGEPVDRFPVFPILIAPACQIVGVRQGLYSQDAEVLADTLLRARALFDFDGVYVSRDNWVYHEALGGKMIFPEDDEPYSRETLLRSVSDFKRLAVPDPETAPGMKTLLSAARQVVAAVAGRFYVQANIDVGPFSLAAILLGLENFLVSISSTPKKSVMELLDFCAEVVVAYGRAMKRAGVHGIQFGDASASLIGPEMYRDYVLPFQERTVAELGGSACDLWVHICGKTDHLLPLIRTLDIQGFEVDAKVDIGDARRLIGHRIALKGNLDTTTLLMQSAREVYEESTRILASYPAQSGLVFSPGCGVPRMTPAVNLAAMVAACRDFRPTSNQPGIQ